MVGVTDTLEFSSMAVTLNDLFAPSHLCVFALQNRHHRGRLDRESVSICVHLWPPPLRLCVSAPLR